MEPRGVADPRESIGTGIFSTPGTVLIGTGGSKGAALLLWILGSVTTITG